eukprot:Amastigsp_a676390_54.p2 type:complete len:198 gc:universal Amastigsp_a676390_54:568-1161(+)
MVDRLVVVHADDDARRKLAHVEQQTDVTVMEQIKAAHRVRNFVLAVVRERSQRRVLMDRGLEAEPLELALVHVFADARAFDHELVCQRPVREPHRDRERSHHDQRHRRALRLGLVEAEQRKTDRVDLFLYLREHRERHHGARSPEAPVAALVVRLRRGKVVHDAHRDIDERVEEKGDENARVENAKERCHRRVRARD